jgi:putative peptidoglycan lipid II flippase
LFLASGTIVSRILGFVSAIILAQVVGTSGAGDAFALATTLPNNIYAIIAGGILTAVLVPQIVKASTDPDGGTRYVNKIITLGFVVFLAVAVVATVSAPLLVALYAEQAGDGSRGFSPEIMALATALAYWCLPQVLFFALYSLLGEVLNARKVFGPYTWAPVVNNIVMIAGLLSFAWIFSGDVSDASVWTPDMVALLGGASTLGIAAQAFVLFLFWRRAGLRYRPDFQWRGVGLAQTGKAAGWVFGMILVTQLAGIIHNRVASLAADDGEPSLAVLRFAWLIFILPHSIVTVSLGTAYFTRMSGHARDGRRDLLRDDIGASLRTITMIMMLATIGLAVVSGPFSRIFSSDPVLVEGMARVLVAFVIGLIPFSTLFITQRVFYALDDTRTPFFIQLAQSGIFVALALVVATLPSPWIAPGIALVTTIAGTAQTLISLAILRRRLGGIGMRLTAQRTGLFALAAIPASAVGLALAVTMGAFDGGAARENVGAAIVTMIAIGGAMTVTYAGALSVLRVPEFTALVDPVAKRLRRR